LIRRAEQSDWVDHAARLGFVAYGLVHLMVAWLAAQLALGDTSRDVSNAGALHALATQPFGAVVVWLVAVGMFLLVGWRLLEAVAGHRDEEGATRWRKRLVSLGKAVVYGVLGWSAVKVALGQGSSGGTDSTTRKLMDLPAGQWIVVAAGLAVIGYGLNLVRRGLSEKFTEHLEAEGQTGTSGRFYVLMGKVGHVAKGFAIGLVGGLLAWAGLTHDAKKSGGLDVALQMLLEQPFGSLLLLAVAAGIAAYGVFCLARARHLDR
jgi:hypothetical protein